MSVLNFLYIPSKNDWNFDHDAKTTLNYYFKSLDKHYIIFEIYKNGYFSIFLRRNDNNDLEYYKIDAPYDEVEKDFFNEKKALLSFEDISENILSKMTKLSKSSVNELIFGKSKKDKSVLWLNNKSNPRQFSKIYKYLLNTKLIDNDRLKESLLIADKKHDDKREFTIQDSKHIEDIKKHQKSIGSLQAVKNDFLKFEELVNEYSVKNERLSSNYNDFDFLYKKEEKNLLNSKESLSVELDNIKNTELQPLLDKERKSTGKLGEFVSDIKHKKNEYDKYKAEINKIKTYEPLSFLKSSLTNVEGKKKDLDYNLSQIERENYTLKLIENKISEEKTSIASLGKQISNFDNLLVHHISDNDEVKTLLSNVLNEDVLKLDKSYIKQKITENIVNSTLNIFDGSIDISTLEKKDFISSELLQIKYDSSIKNLDKYENILKNIENISTIELEIKELEKKVSKLTTQIKEVNSLAKLEEELKIINSNKDDLINEKSNIEQSLKDNKVEIEKLNVRIASIKTEIGKIDNRFKDISLYRIVFEDELKQLTLNFEELNYDKTIDVLFEEMKNLKSEVSNLKNDKDKSFESLKEKLLKEHASEELFIKEVKEELSSLVDKEESVNRLIDSIANDISKPTKDFLLKLDEFESYIKNVNRKFKKYKISDLDSVEVVLHRNSDLIKELSAIATIKKENLLDVNDFNPSYQIETLKKYIEHSKTIYLSDLFDIKFSINNKNVNMGRQAESNGTDRILKITLFIVIMQDLLIEDKDNKLVIYVDELGEVDDDNLFEFISRCKENNFLPIFAGPDKKPHIDKYYDLLPLENKQIVVDENRAIYVEN